MCLSMHVRVCTRMMVTVFSVHVYAHACTCVHAHDGVFSVHVSEHACTRVQCACV